MIFNYRVFNYKMLLMSRTQFTSLLIVTLIYNIYKYDK